MRTGSSISANRYLLPVSDKFADEPTTAPAPRNRCRRNGVVELTRIEQHVQGAGFGGVFNDERIGGREEVVLGAKRRHDRKRQPLLLDYFADNSMPPLVHAMDLAAQLPIAEHAGRLVVRAALDLKNTAHAGRGRRHHRICDIKRNDADAAGVKRRKQRVDIGA